MFSVKSYDEIEFEIPKKNALGQRAGGAIVFRYL
jgi:hypothetical protein